ncbi:MAG: 2-amino-4-hydroxy-6-hydroxymethyldihydropteridine diphosphokinase [Candidatus Sumerlaeota bacterium]
MGPQREAICLMGSNVGRRSATLRRATFSLAATPGIDLLGTSKIYDTPPWGKTDQPRYYNAACRLLTRLAPEALLDVFQDIEAALGRDRARETRWGPRTLDLDLGLYGSEIIQTERLTVPHADLHRRGFALVPLLEVAPEAVEPESGALYRDILEGLPENERAGLEPVGPLAFDVRENPASRVTSGDALTLWRSESPEDTEAFAAQFSGLLRGGEVIAMVGDLGAGKTCFARGLARGLGVEEPVVSPSYVLVRSYEGRLALHHADFYRLTSDALTDGERAEAGEAPELASLGLDDYLDEPDAVVLVEWADHFPDWLEPPFYRILVTGSGESPRYLLIQKVA